MKLRIISNGITNNLDNDDVNLYDTAIPLATALLVNEAVFKYSYPNAECTFEIESIPGVDINNEFITWMDAECSEVEFEILESKEIIDYQPKCPTCRQILQSGLCLNTDCPE